jgi:predicted DCC family thiol-disulfide oxidoreductase YuxK
VSEVTLLYDADCGFCRWSLDKILRRDKAKEILPVPIQSAEGQELLRDMDEDKRMASWHLVDENGRIFSAGAAVPEISRHLRGGAPVGSLAKQFPKSTDRLYRLIARNRHKLGKAIGEQACSVDPSSRSSGRR